MQRELSCQTIRAHILLCWCQRCGQGWQTYEGKRSSCLKLQCTFPMAMLAMRCPWGIKGLCILLPILRQKKQLNSYCTLFV